MIRKIITIEEEKCNGCGLCAQACHEGAIGMVDGKAKLLREDYCDGLGDCLPVCPVNAISFQEREAPACRKAAEKQAGKTKSPKECPATACKSVCGEAGEAAGPAPSELTNFPVQLRLVPPNAPYFDGAELLIAADCTAYAYGDFHREFVRGRVTLIGCPKLDPADYSRKLTEIFRENDIRSVTVTRMTVPCCGGLSYAVKTALENCGSQIPFRTVSVSPEGRIVE